MAGYVTRLRRDFDRWVGLGLVERGLADTLVADAEGRERAALSFGSVLMIMAALLVAAALLILIAANWVAFPRLGRVAALFAAIAAGYLGGAFLKLRGHGAIAEGLWLVAAAAFGGAIALIGQMYHMSGDEEAALLTWCAGTMLAAAALRSGPLTVACVGILAFWMLSEGFDFWSRSGFPFRFLAWAAAVWLVSLWTRSFAARHLLVLSAIAYGTLWGIDFGVGGAGAVMAGVSAAAFAAAVALPQASENVVRLGGRLPLHALIGFLAAAAMIQVQLADRSASIVLAALVVFAAIAAAVVLAGRESRGLRWLAYLGFSLELGFVYVVTVGTMLDTASLFFLSGLALAAVAFLIIKVERRIAPPAAVRAA